MVGSRVRSRSSSDSQDDDQPIKRKSSNSPDVELSTWPKLTESELSKYCAIWHKAHGAQWIPGQCLVCGKIYGSPEKIVRHAFYGHLLSEGASSDYTGVCQQMVLLDAGMIRLNFPNPYHLGSEADIILGSLLKQISEAADAIYQSAVECARKMKQPLMNGPSGDSQNSNRIGDDFEDCQSPEQVEYYQSLEQVDDHFGDFQSFDQAQDDWSNDEPECPECVLKFELFWPRHVPTERRPWLDTN